MLRHKNQAGMIALGECFYVQTLKNWTRWGVMGVINPRHSDGDCQNKSHLPL